MVQNPEDTMTSALQAEGLGFNPRQRHEPHKLIYIAVFTISGIFFQSSGIFLGTGHYGEEDVHFLRTNFVVDWRWEEGCEDYIHKDMLLSWFVDFPSEKCPFSIHSLVKIGESLGKKPSEWYGPANVAYILR